MLLSRRRMVLVASATMVSGCAVASSLMDAVVGASVRQATRVATPIVSQGSTAADAKDLVWRAMDAFYNRHEVSTVDALISADYREHSPHLADGRPAFRDLIARFDESVAYECLTLVGDGDLVAALGIFHGLASAPITSLNLFRVVGDQIIEHWAGVTPQASPAPEVDCQEAVQRAAPASVTAATRATVEGFTDEVLVDGRRDRAIVYVDPARLVDHGRTLLLAEHPPMKSSHADAWLRYHVRHRVVADGGFAVVQSHATLMDTLEYPVVCYDVYRVAGSHIVEHWDVTEIITAPPRHGNGLF